MLTGLQQLRLSTTQLTGPLPAAWGALNELQHLDLSHTPWQPGTPDAW